MSEYPRPCEGCQAEGLWPWETSGPFAHRYLCPTCRPIFQANRDRREQDEAAFAAYLDSRPKRMIFSSLNARERYKASWLRYQGERRLRSGAS